jgi:hypothetical protein
MGKNERTITEVVVTVTFQMNDLGTFGPGCLVDYVRDAAAVRLSEMLGGHVDPSHVRVESVSTADGKTNGTIEAIRS